MLLSNEGFRRLCHARERLRDCDESAPTIEALARDLGVSPFHFSRQFEAVFGTTPHQYRMRARLDRARDLLAEGRMSVTDICMDVGFSSLGSFSALFSRTFGESPTAYARRVRGQNRTPACLSLMSALDDRSFREA